MLHGSSDQGATWPNTYTVFQDPGVGIGYLEQKLIETEPGRMPALAWAQDFAKDTDLKNAFSVSSDGGHTWKGPYPTGVQSVRMCLVRVSGSRWTLEFEGTLFDAGTRIELTGTSAARSRSGSFSSAIRWGCGWGTTPCSPFTGAPKTAPAASTGAVSA